MTIADVCNEYPNIDFGYTQTLIPIVDCMPDGYRWADEVEVEYWWHIKGAVQVSVGEDQTDLAVPQN